jgi:hypothetical protein
MEGFRNKHGYWQRKEIIPEEKSWNVAGAGTKFRTHQKMEVEKKWRFKVIIL